jgi:large subunit ribosomal protein L4
MTLSLTVQHPADGTSGATIELPAEIFGVEANIALIHQVVVAQLAAARQGTASTKTRGEVRGGGKKPYRQKGTGRARQGSTRAPQFAGGGVVHGPSPRSYTQRTPKKMKAAALRGALSDRARHDRVHVVSGLVSGDVPSTKDAAITLAAVSGAGHLLVVAERADEVTWLSLRNLDGVHVLEPGQLNTYDVLISDEVIFTSDALSAFLGGPPIESAPAASAPVQVTKRPAKATPAKADAAVETAETHEAAHTGEAARAGAVEGEHGFGPDAHLPLPDGGEPDGFPIKGNASSKLYHVPGSAFYKRTVAEVWFRTAEAAEAAGFALPPSQRAKKEDA